MLLETFKNKILKPTALATILFAVATALVGCGGDGETDDGSAASGGGDKLQIRSRFDDYGNAVTTDTSGNVYIAGYVGDALPGQTSAGRTDAFVRKLDSSLAEIWTK